MIDNINLLEYIRVKVSNENVKAKGLLLEVVGFATLRFPIPCPWALGLKGEVNLEILSCKVGDASTEVLFLIKGDKDRKWIERKLVLNPHIMRFSLFSSRKGCYIGYAKSSLCACVRAGLHRLHILKGRTTEGGMLEFTVFGNRHEIRNVAKRFKAIGVPVDLCEKVDVKVKSTLTRKQMMILKTALQLGFFDYPKKINLKELSRIFGDSSSTIDEVMRRGMKRILEFYFKTMILEDERW